jgi:hypothetical protein
MGDARPADVFPQILGMEAASDSANSASLEETEIETGAGILVDRMLLLHRVEVDWYDVINAMLGTILAGATAVNRMQHVIGKRGFAAAADLELGYPGVLCRDTYGGANTFTSSGRHIHADFSRREWIPPGLIPWASKYISLYMWSTTDVAGLRSVYTEGALWYILTDVDSDLFREFAQLWSLLD